jgi:predicted outer membrane repeat protein
LKKRIRQWFRPAIEGLETRLVPATTFKVTTLKDVVNPTDAVLSLREAITLANHTPGPDVIQLTLPGTYEVRIPGLDNKNAAGDFDVTDSLTVIGLGASATRIDSDYLDRVFDLLGPINVTFANLTLQNGGNDQTFGGAIQALTANVTLNNCVLLRNVGAKGGAINAEAGKVTLNNCTLKGNVTLGPGNGGAIFAGTGPVVLDGTTFTTNTAGGRGGAIFVQHADVTMSRSTLTGNHAAVGGAIDDEAGNVSLRSGSVVRGNSSDGDGGGIFDLGTVTLSGSTVQNNVSKTSGGGVAAITVNGTGSTVSGNRTDGFGGGLSAGVVALTDCRLSGNAAGSNGGGIFSRLTASAGNNGGTISLPGKVALLRCTLDRNSARENGGGVDVPGGTLSLQNSTVRLNVAGTVRFGRVGDGGRGGGVFTGSATVTASTLSGNSAFLGGGALFAADSLTLTNSALSGNRAFDDFALGGGLEASTVVMTGSTVRSNAAASGGGIYATSVNLTNTAVSGNAATADGGGIFASAAATLTNSAVTANASRTSGGGIVASEITLKGCTVSDNTTLFSGGGIYASTKATLAASTVSDNFAGEDGGGIAAHTVSLTNTTVSGNSAGVGNGVADSGQGGGISAQHGTILNCTIVENFATGSGGGLVGFATADFIHLKNTIIAGNSVQGLRTGVDVSGTFVSEGHNLIGVVDPRFPTGFGVAGDRLGTLDAPLDPRLGPLQNNGGPTQTHALLAGSPAIDHGSSAGAPATDQRGVVRPLGGISGNVVDIGAFEK